ncbi:DLH domain-containing protein [Chloropicon primus]|uniref:PET hydrolase/cutinase-like domain-containing protein n=1 Tax=Chloropicon primus TaxID=1764295 RepID=A0A5B8MD55_9CHLO|nr:hypothetical protein A3770_01p08510 [Chloropicon primus]UPQ97544.1 DLH domain-containing protein [Chloropicon primus]|eukprot:QDZ18333.1 hypothetical protein A3770_01p08510 [Chloropicon primus]
MRTESVLAQHRRGVLASLFAAIALSSLAVVARALPEAYAQQGNYPVTTTVLTVPRSEGLGLPFQCTVYYPTNAGAGGGKCTDVASCYLQSVSTPQDAPVSSDGNFPLVAFGLNTFISGQEVYGSTMRHIASHGFVVAATNSRFIQPAAEAIEMVDCIRALQRQQNEAGSKFYQKLNLGVKVGVLGYSQGGAASLDTAARLGDDCAACITQHAQPSMMASQIKCPVFMHSGDQDSLTGIMKAMIWGGVRTPKVFAIMRGAHHLTPVPPSPWDPWSLAWLRLYQKGDMQAGDYIWGTAATVGSLRSLQMSGGMSEVLFDPTAPWSRPYSQYGLQVGPAAQGTFSVLPTQEKSAAGAAAPASAAGSPWNQPAAAPQMQAPGRGPSSMLGMFAPGGGGSPSMFGMPGLMGSGSPSASGTSSPFSFLQSLMGRYGGSAMPSMQPSMGMGNTLSNTAGSLTGVTNIPVTEQETIHLDAVQTKTTGSWNDPSMSAPALQEDALDVVIEEQHTWSPIRRVSAPKGGSQQRDIQRKIHEKQVKALSQDLGGPYCETSEDCCFPGSCRLTVSTVVTTSMCSLPGGGLGKLASDPTCRRASSSGAEREAVPPTSGSFGSPDQVGSGSVNRFALAPKAASTFPQQSTELGNDPPRTAGGGPSLSLADCNPSSMTLRLDDAAPGSTVVVMGSIYVPKATQVDQLVLLSNTRCPTIDVNIKMPKQSLSSQFLKTKVVQPQSQNGLVVFDNTDGDACNDYVYQAVDMTNCVAGPVLDLR